ncbi:MAG: hypothetical protein GIW95_08990 [Candidatus Eremiobacteraeota bacterium]|nr:hypothetical protein [Candidatus Eremiobacteraeota bacterium]
MKKLFFALAFGASLAPIAVAAQPGPGGPPPEMRAKMEAMRADTKATVQKALSADHQSKIQAVVDQFNTGTLAPKDAVAQIDAILTPDEAKSALAADMAMRDKMRAMRDQMGGPGGPMAQGPNGGPPHGAPPNGGPPNGTSPKGDAMRGPDAGRFVLQMYADPQKLRDAMRAQRDGVDKQPK